MPKFVVVWPPRSWWWVWVQVGMIAFLMFLLIAAVLQSEEFR